MKIAAAYIRVSTNDQMEYSPDSQLDCILDYARKNGYELPEKYIFREDDGISGRETKKRTAFQRMIAQAKRRPRPFDCILLWKFSRFARSRADSVLYKTMLRRQGIDVISVSEPLGDDKTSILVEAMIEAMDEYYSVNLAEEVRRGMKEKVLRGEPVTVPPFGYRIREKHFVPHAEEASVVKLMYSDFLSGSSPVEIADKLNAMGWRTGRGGPWRARSVRYILKNPVYRGSLRWNPNGPLGRDVSADETVSVPNSHQAIVSRDLWDSVQKLLRTAPSQRRTSPDCALKGLVFCSSCGSLLVPSSSGSMQCSGYSHGTCKVSHCISLQKLDAMVLAFLKTDLRVTGLHISPPGPEENQETDSLLTHRLKTEKKRLSRLLNAYLDGAEPLEDYEQKQGEIKRTIHMLEAELSQKHQGRNADFKSDLILFLQDGKVTARQKNTVMRLLIDKIVFDRKQNLLRIYYR